MILRGRAKGDCCLCVAILCLAALIATAGCNSDPYERVVVSGSVHYDGEPIREGMIRVLPVNGTQTPPNGGYIREGRYNIATKGGVAVGEYQVVIEAYRLKSTASQSEVPLAGVPGGAAIQFLPRKYNERTVLKLTVESGSDELVKDFDLDP